MPIIQYQASIVGDIGSALLSPFLLILYNLLVIWPNQIIFWLLTIIQKITGFDNDGLNSSLFGNGSDFSAFQVFGGFILFGLVIGIIMIIIGIIRILTSDKEPKKVLVFGLVKRSLFAMLVSSALPASFWILTLVVNTVFTQIFNISTPLNAKIDDNRLASEKFLGIVHALKNGDDSINPYVFMNRLMVFNTWTVGYNGPLIITSDFIKNNQGFTPQYGPYMAGNKSYQELGIPIGIGEVIQHIIKLNDHKFFSESPADYFKQLNINQWNVVLSAIGSVLFLYGIMTFVISVIARLLWVYILIIIAPIIIGGSMAMEKNVSKFIVDFVQKVVIVQFAVVGYFLFSLIYTTIMTNITTKNNLYFSSITFRILQFGILFAGVSLINQIPMNMIRYFNSNEQVVGNELKAAQSQLSIISRPLHAATTGLLASSLNSARQGAQHSLRHGYNPQSFQNERPNLSPPRSLS